jgi:hypothetical protein
VTLIEAYTNENTEEASKITGIKMNVSKTPIEKISMADRDFTTTCFINNNNNNNKYSNK